MSVIIFRRANVAENRIKIEREVKKNYIYLALSEGARMLQFLFT
jgi:hypothetical protein